MSSSSERLVVVGGFGLAAASLVPWYRADELGFGVDVARTNGWQEPDAVLSIVATIVGTALALLVLAFGRGQQRPAVGTWTWGTLLTGISAGACGLVALKFSLNTDNTTVGIYVAVAAAVTQLYGAYVTRLDEAAVVRNPGAPPPAGPAIAPAASAAHPQWPETAYFLTTWLRPGLDVPMATAAYRRAFANDVPRQVRLVGELHSLLDPSRSDAERIAFVRGVAPHLATDQASPILGVLLQALMTPIAP